MDFEAPVDAWYVWLGIVFVSVVFLGLVFELPTQAPPDADGAGNVVEELATAGYAASATYEHSADEIRLDTTRIALRNDGGIDRTQIQFGTIVPVEAAENESHRTVLSRAVTAKASDIRPPSTDLRIAIDETVDTFEGNQMEWQPAHSPLRMRVVTVEGERFVLVSVSN